MKKIISILIILFFFTGCDTKEISDLAITGIMGIDKIEKKYVVSTIIMGKEEGKKTLYVGEDSSLLSAIQKLNDKLTENLYLGHLQTVIINEQIGKDGLDDIINYFIKEDIIQNNFYFFLAKDIDSKDILNYLLENNSSYSLVNFFKENGNMELRKNISSIHSFMKNIKDPDVDSVMHTIALKEKSLFLHDIALFKKDKLKGFSDMTGYYLLKGGVKSLNVPLKCKDGKTIMSIKDIKTKKSKKKSTVYIEINGTLSMTENSCNINIKNQKEQEKVKKQVEKNVLKKINTFLKDSEKYKVYPLGYKTLLHSKQNHFIQTEIHLRMEKLEKKGDLHE